MKFNNSQKLKNVAVKRYTFGEHTWGSYIVEDVLRIWKFGFVPSYFCCLFLTLET